MASGLVGTDGFALKAEPVEYKIGDFGFSTNAVPADLLGRALSSARTLHARQSPGQPSPANPFHFEPAAQAVFMFLVQEIQRVQTQLDELESLLAPVEDEAPNEGDEASG